MSAVKYTFGSVLQYLFAHGTDSGYANLEQMLAGHYDGTATIYRKGRSALAEAVRIATRGEGGAVAISGLTCYSVVQAVEAAGCTPVFVDIREADLHFGADELAAAIKQHGDIKAVIVQNMLGIPVDILAIHQVTKEAGLALIEDLAHSAGALYLDGHEVGTVGDITMLSFGSDKAIDTVNGGALIVRSAFGTKTTMPHAQPRWRDQLRDRLFPLIAWMRALFPARIGPYVMAVAIKLRLVVRSADDTVNPAVRLSDWQARLALAQLKHITDIAAARHEKVRAYQEVLTVNIPTGAVQGGAAPVRLPLLVKNRKEVVAHLRANGVQANDIWYNVPVSPRRLYEKMEYPEAACPVAVRVAAQLINLPTHERITTVDIAKIAALVNEVAEQ